MNRQIAATKTNTGITIWAFEDVKVGGGTEFTVTIGQNVAGGWKLKSKKVVANEAAAIAAYNRAVARYQ